MGSQAQSARDITAEVDAVYPHAEALYLDLHRHPELSSHEQQTAAKLASGLRALGYEVSTGVGRTGVVGVLRNGNGPVVLLRTELDALPVEEKTGCRTPAPCARKTTAAQRGCSRTACSRAFPVLIMPSPCTMTRAIPRVSSGITQVRFSAIATP
jgi:hippurate hydrolase